MVLAQSQGCLGLVLLAVIRLENLVEGRNSFTEGQAKSRIEGAGYSNVSGLHKDDQGVWRGKAEKAGTKTDVSLDFQGNVNPAK